MVSRLRKIALDFKSSGVSGRGPHTKQSSYLNILICHSNIVCVRVQIFWCSHHGKLYRPLVAEGFVGPFSYRSDLFDCCDTVVGNENLAKYTLAREIAAGSVF